MAACSLIRMVAASRILCAVTATARKLRSGRTEMARTRAGEISMSERNKLAERGTAAQGGESAAEGNRAERSTPGKPADTGSRQQTRADQQLDSGSASLDHELSGRGAPVKPHARPPNEK